MPTPSVLDRFEAAFEHALTRFENAVASRVALLERYAARMYRFLRHMFVQMLRAVRLLITLTVFFLAPGYVLAFGWEVVIKGVHWSVKIGGFLLSLLSFISLVFMVLGLFAHMRSRRGADGITESRPNIRRAFITVASFDALVVFLIYTSHWYLPGYEFSFPLFRWTDALLRRLF